MINGNRRLSGVVTEPPAEPSSGIHPKLGYVAGVSWPRSGHHLLERMLIRYFGDSFGYCEYYEPEDCCKTFPCARAGQINFSKTHDYNFEIAQLDHVKYLIQYRDFPHATVSNFELHIGGGNGPDTAEEFQIYAGQQWEEYRKFKRKWVTSEFAKSQLVVSYADLMSDPVGIMKKVLSLFNPETVPDVNKLKKIVSTIEGISRGPEGVSSTGWGVKATRKLQDFRYYDKELFSRLDRLVLGRRDVLDACKEILGYVPDTMELLALHCCKTDEELRHRLRGEGKVRFQ